MTTSCRLARSQTSCWPCSYLSGYGLCLGKLALVIVQLPTRRGQRWKYGLLFKPLLPTSFGQYKQRSKMNPIRPLVIHELLPSEIMGVLFEEHAKLEWRAPAIDGRVCRIWRQIVLNTPRAWVYLEINYEGTDTIQELRKWLCRSGSTPLHICVNQGIAFDESIDERPLYVLRGYHTRIASLRLPAGDPFFFDRRDFPCLRLLEIFQWHSLNYPSRSVRWDSMLELRSLRLAATVSEVFPLQWSELSQLEVLSLYSASLTSLPQHSQSLTTLVLDNVSVEDAILSPMAFPSLTYLSLFGVIGLKAYINAPCLVTFHEGLGDIFEPLSSPVASLVEYGAFLPPTHEGYTAKWHRSFPNLLRLSIRAGPRVLLPFLRSLSSDPHSLPALQMITARDPGTLFTEKKQSIMKALVQVRRDAYQMDLALYFETEPPFRIPLFFGEVSDCLSNNYECLMHILGSRSSFLKVVAARGLVYEPTSRMHEGSTPEL